MDISRFDYTLPPDRIANTPAHPRDSAKLLVVYRDTGRLLHATVSDLPELLPKQTTIVTNNSKVRHARLTTTSGKEVLLLDRLARNTYECIGTITKPQIDMKLTLAAGPHRIEARISATHSHGAMNTFTLAVDHDEDIENLLEEHGALPLPHYIQSPVIQESDYQTVYAKEVGSAAAPTAGLHFTESLLSRLEAAGMRRVEVTLHVGLGTFLPLRNATVEENRLHKEHTHISQHTANALTVSRNANNPMLAIGTTSLRTLEGHWDRESREFAAGAREVDVFITPEYHVDTASMLLTNFHLPKSSLLVLVMSMLRHNKNREIIRDCEGALSLMHRAYEVAIASDYRFYSLGDAMLIANER